MNAETAALLAALTEAYAKNRWPVAEALAARLQSLGFSVEVDNVWQAFWLADSAGE